MTERPHHLVRAAAASLGLALPAVALAWSVRAAVPAVVELDEAVVTAATDLTREEAGLRRVLLVWQELSQPRWVDAAGIALAAWVWRRHGLRARTAWAVVTVLTAWGVSTLVKVAVGRARPVVDDAVTHASGFSFPSGHATNTTAAAVALTVLLWPLLGRRGRAVAVALAVVVVVLTGLNRVLLGVHHPSDVVAGTLLGAAVAVGSWIGWSGNRDRSGA